MSKRYYSSPIDSEVVGLTKGAGVAQMGFSIALTIALFSLFVPVFFFDQAAAVEKKVVKTSLEDLVAEFSNEFKFLLSPAQTSEVGKVLSGVVVPDMSTEDAQMSARNSQLKQKAWKVLGSGSAAIVCCIVLIYLIMFLRVKKAHGNMKAELPDMAHLAFSVAVGFASVIGIEFLFLFVVARQYKPLDSNAVKYSFVNTLLQIANLPPTGAKGPSSTLLK